MSHVVDDTTSKPGPGPRYESKAARREKRDFLKAVGRDLDGAYRCWFRQDRYSFTRFRTNGEIFQVPLPVKVERANRRKERSNA